MNPFRRFGTTPWVGVRLFVKVFGTLWDKITSRGPAILTAVFRGFSQMLQTNAEILP